MTLLKERYLRYHYTGSMSYIFTIIIWETLNLRINFAITITTILYITEIESGGGKSSGGDSES